MANILVRWLLVGFVAALHPFYVSIIDIQHNSKEKSLEISVRIFTEDLEATLKKTHTGKFDIYNATNKDIADKLITNYIKQKIHLTIDQKKVELDYVGFEHQKESTWIYFEVNNVAAFKKATINSTLLYDFEEKQINIIHVKNNGVQKSYKLEYPKSDANFEF